MAFSFQKTYLQLVMKWCVKLLYKAKDKNTDLFRMSKYRHDFDLNPDPRGKLTLTANMPGRRRLPGRQHHVHLRRRAPSLPEQEHGGIILKWILDFLNIIFSRIENKLQISIVV